MFYEPGMNIGIQIYKDFETLPYYYGDVEKSDSNILTIKKCSETLFSLLFQSQNPINLFSNLGLLRLNFSRDFNGNKVQLTSTLSLSNETLIRQVQKNEILGPFYSLYSKSLNIPARNSYFLQEFSDSVYEYGELLSNLKVLEDKKREQLKSQKILIDFDSTYMNFTDKVKSDPYLSEKISTLPEIFNQEVHIFLEEKLKLISKEEVDISYSLIEKLMQDYNLFVK